VGVVEALREDIRKLGRRGDLYEPHLAVLNDRSVGEPGEVLPNVNMLGSLSPSNDVVSQLDAGRVVPEHLGGVFLSDSEAKSLNEFSEVQDMHPCRRRRLVLYACCRESRSLLHLGAPHDRRLVVQHHVHGCRLAG
jgi:hypothetical protein